MEKQIAQLDHQIVIITLQLILPLLRVTLAAAQVVVARMLRSFQPLHGLEPVFREQTFYLALSSTQDQAGRDELHRVQTIIQDEGGKVVQDLTHNQVALSLQLLKFPAYKRLKSSHPPVLTLRLNVGDTRRVRARHTRLPRVSPRESYRCCRWHNRCRLS
jgi:hypothetical protein